MSVERITRKSGARVYRVRWREHGRNPARAFDRRPDTEAWDREIKRRQQLGPLAVEQLTDRGVTLAQWIIERWTPEHGITLARSTREAYAAVHAGRSWVLPPRPVIESRLVVAQAAREGRVDLDHPPDPRLNVVVPSDPWGMLRRPSTRRVDLLHPSVGGAAQQQPKEFLQCRTPTRGEVLALIKASRASSTAGGLRVNALLAEQAGLANTDLTTAVEIIDTNTFPSVDDLYSEARKWYRMRNVVAVSVDLKNSTALSVRERYALTSARLYEAATGSAVRLVSKFAPQFIDIQGDGLFALFHGTRAFERAFCAGVTIKTFSEMSLEPLIQANFASEFPETASRLASHRACSSRTRWAFAGPTSRFGRASR